MGAFVPRRHLATLAVGFVFFIAFVGFVGWLVEVFLFSFSLSFLVAATGAEVATDI